MIKKLISFGMIKKIIFYSACVIVILAIILGVYFFAQINWPAGDNQDKKLFTIISGQSVDEISNNLKEADLLRSKISFKAYLWLSGMGANLQAGDYYLTQNINIIELVNSISAGEVIPNETKVTIVEGLTAEAIAETLVEKDLIEKERFLELIDTHDSREFLPDKNYDFLIDRSKNAGLEGYLFPDTYMLYNTSTEEEVIEKMLDNFDNKLTNSLKQEIANQGKTIFEIVTLASIIEKEARKTEDRKILAGVFYSRLDIGMAMQSDATVNYITGKRTIRPTLEDISVDSKYNTYKYPGLPPGPICSPSLDSIKAAIYPIDSDYMYFITRSDGSSDFSLTYEEHLEKKEKYYGS